MDHPWAFVVMVCSPLILIGAVIIFSPPDEKEKQIGIECVKAGSEWVVNKDNRYECRNKN